MKHVKYLEKVDVTSSRCAEFWSRNQVKTWISFYLVSKDQLINHGGSHLDLRKDFVPEKERYNFLYVQEKSMELKDCFCFFKHGNLEDCVMFFSCF